MILFVKFNQDHRNLTMVWKKTFYADESYIQILSDNAIQISEKIDNLNAREILK